MKKAKQEEEPLIFKILEEIALILIIVIGFFIGYNRKGD